jgi:dienelactone hydrolase
MFARSICLTLGALFCLSLSAPAADAPKPLPGDKGIERYLREETKRIEERFLDGAKTRAEWEARRSRLRREYFDMLGLWPLPPKTPLKATVTGTLARPGIVIEKLHFQSRPGLYVTGNLYRPKKAEGRLPAILYVCGHSNRGRNGNKTAFQDHGQWFATNGYVCLVIDTLQLGEVAGKHHGTYNLGRWWWQARGYTPAGVECWNGIRAIDYLISRPDVDANRIGVTGISGGGAATFWIAAADERVRCAVPVSGMSDLESYVSNKVINGHCDCMFLYNTYGWHWTTIAALIAPRPLLFANSDNDRIFPMDGNRRIIARLRQLYGLYGKPELVDDYVSKGGHAYRPDLRVAIFKWINKHVKGDTGPVTDANFKPIPGKDLRVFPEDRDLPADALNARIDETFVPKAEVKLPEAKDFAAWKKSMLKQLRERSFRALPADIAPLKLKDATIGLFTSEHDIEATLHPLRKSPEPTSLVVMDRSITDESKPLPDLKLRDKNYWLLFPRGVLHGAWSQKSPPNYVERAHVLLGRTVDEGRVQDIIAAVKYLQQQNKTPARVVGVGEAGILVAYAALLEPSIKEVVIIDPPASHRDGPIFLNVLRVLDVPEALGLLAPRPLTLVGGKDKVFERTAAIYKLAGAKEKLRRLTH